MIYKKTCDELVLILIDKLTEYRRKNSGKSPLRLEFYPNSARLSEDWRLRCPPSQDPNSILLFSGLRPESILDLIKEFSGYRFKNVVVDKTLIQSVKFFDR